MAKKSTARPRGFSFSGHEEGMHHPRSPDRDDRAGPASGPRERTIADLYAEHWPYVIDLLPSYGISAQEAEDVAQTAWLHLHRRRGSYDETKHKTRRAWITGFVQRCAANHRRTQRREGVALEEPGDQVLASGLNPEQATILRDLHRMIPNDEQREALLLQVRHGLSIAEIAAVQEVSESAVGWRLSMARKALMDDDEEKKSRAFLGFGSLAALAEALKPRPIPPEVGERQWQKIAERIRQEEAAPSDTDPPPSSQPPAAALPATASPVAPTLAGLGNMKTGILLLLVFLSGAGVLAWKSAGATGHGPATAAVDAATAPSAAPSTSSTPSAGESQLLLARMREAMNGRQFSTVLTLAAQHAQRFGATNVREREALRIEALRQTGRVKDAAQHARAVLATYPEHRRAIERAAGQALP